MRTSTGTTIGVVTECVNVHATLSIGVVASDIPGDGGGGGLIGLFEGNGSGNFGVTTEDSD